MRYDRNALFWSRDRDLVLKSMLCARSGGVGGGGDWRVSMVTYAVVTPGRLILDVRTTHSTHIRPQGSHLLMKFAVMQLYSLSLPVEETIDFIAS